MRLIRNAALIAAMLAGLASSIVMTPAVGQVPSILNPPANQDLSSYLIVNTLRTASTVYSAAQNNLNWKGVQCVLSQNPASSSGSPSTTFFIQNYDAASGTYYTIATSGAMTSGATQGLEVYPGVITGDTVGATITVKGLNLTRVWRVGQTIGGTSGPAITGGGIGCNYLK